MKIWKKYYVPESWPDQHWWVITIEHTTQYIVQIWNKTSHSFILYFQDKKVLLWTRLNIQQMTDPCYSELSEMKRVGLRIHVSTAVRRDLHWLPIQARIQFKLNIITRNCLVGQAPAYLTELCHFINEIPARRNLRSATQVQLLVPRFRKERSGRRGFSISSPQLWNLLPTDIRLLYKEPQLFRRRLKTHYMQQSISHHWGSMSPVRHLLLLLLLL